jgi:phage-related protein
LSNPGQLVSSGPVDHPTLQAGSAHQTLLSDGSETFLHTFAPIFHAVDSPIAAIIAFVLAVVRSTIGTIANAVTALFPELHAILDAVTDIPVPVVAALDPQVG